MTALHTLTTDNPVDTSTLLIPRSASPVAYPSRWSDLAQADKSRSSYRLSRVADSVVLVTITLAGDLPLIATTLNRVLRDDPVISWGLGIALTLASVMLALNAGVYARKAVTQSRSARVDATITAVLTLGWLLLGVGLFTLRWNAAQFGPVVIVYEGATDTAVAEAAKEQLLAAVLATVYVATGILAAIDGYKHTNPVAAALRAARAQRDKILPRLHAQEALVARLSENLAVATREFTGLADEHAIAIQSREALAAELKAYARVLMAIHLGDPSATGLVRPAHGISEQPLGQGPATAQGAG